MNLEDFTDKEQKQINAGLSTAEISDKEAADSEFLLKIMVFSLHSDFKVIEL